MSAAHMTTVNGRPALVQTFAPGNTVRSYEREGKEAVREVMAKVPKGDIDKNVLFDYLMGSTDVHAGNFLVSPEGKFTAIDKEMVLGRGNLKGQKFVIPSYLQHVSPNGIDTQYAFDPATVKDMADKGQKMADELRSRGMNAEARQVQDRVTVLQKLASSPTKTAGALYALGSGGVTPPNLSLFGKLAWHLTKG